MLVLSRFPDEQVVVSVKGEEILRLKVLGVRGNRVRLGLEARKEIQIDRDELYERKKAEPIATRAG